jgi:peroxiredoxin Q/BCP
MLTENAKAPDFELEGSDGKKHTLKEFKGKKLILYFYPKDNTPGCTIEAKNFNKSLDKIHSLGAEVVGVSKDDLKSHEKFCGKYNLNFLLLSDPESKMIKSYDAYGDRGIFGMGTLRKTVVINKNGKVLKIFEKVKPDKHDQEIINLLESIKQ